jgi:ATP-binding cassette subfamily B protein
VSGGRQRLLAPEVIQTSAMDCGPAALKCLLEGFGVPVSYGRLREACQTDVDGTSIDTMEDVGAQLGLDCEQLMTPKDHLLLAEADSFPAIVVVRLPNGFTHFVVAWRRHGPLVQLMDPSTGRRWLSGRRFLEEVYEHTTPVPAATFRDWARSDEFVHALRARLRELGCADRCGAAIDEALADEGWRAMATLDAAVRMTGAVVRGGGVARGEGAARLVGSLVRAVGEGKAAIPDAYYKARPAPQEGPDEEVLLRGAILVRARRAGARAREDAPASPRPLSRELCAALAEKPSKPARTLLSLLRADGLLTMPVLVLGLFGAVLGATLEAVLFRGLFDVGRVLGIVQHRLAAMGALVLFALVLLALEVPIAGGALRLGRRLEVRLRMAFLRKIPRLGDRYFQSRPTSDMAERSHAIHDVRALPDFGTQLVRVALELVVTTAAIAWIDRASALWAVAVVVASVAASLLAQPAVIERDLRMRSHQGALARYYLDTLLGLVPVRTHGAERSVRREHEALLGEWVRSARALVRATVTAEGAQTLAAYCLTVPLLLGYLGRSAEPACVLLLLYWALELPTLGQELALTMKQYPARRNRMLRLLEPLGAPEEKVDDAPPAHAVPRRDASSGRARGASVVFDGVGIVAGGHAILEGVDLTLAPGEHVAVVGASGAGKSSLLGALLGWHVPSAGTIRVDGEPLDRARTDALRRDLAWVDPAVTLWNQTLYENLRYGSTLAGAPGTFAAILDAAELHETLQKMPDGLQTTLGEGGGLVSGGEGQRVRLGRALAREDARLVLLDEPFRGLDRERRHALLARARAWWKGATLLCVTHDISETRGFERVVVIDGGRIVEDGRPDVLAGTPGSRYAAMLAGEEDLRLRTWSASMWRRLRLTDGRIRA